MKVLFVSWHCLDGTAIGLHQYRFEMRATDIPA